MSNTPKFEDLTDEELEPWAVGRSAAEKGQAFTELKRRESERKSENHPEVVERQRQVAESFDNYSSNDKAADELIDEYVASLPAISIERGLDRDRLPGNDACKDEIIERAMRHYSTTARGRNNLAVKHIKSEEESWLVPGLIHYRGKVALAGESDIGKGWMLGCWAANLSLGIHPLTLEKLEHPLSIALINLDMSEDVANPLLAGVQGVLQAGTDSRIPGCFTEFSADPIDITDPDGYDHFLENLKTYAPIDILMIGPLDRVHGSQDPAMTTTTAATKAALDHLAKDLDCALIVEAHSNDANLIFGGRSWTWWFDNIVTMKWNASKNLATLTRRKQRSQVEWPQFERSEHPGDLPWMPVGDFIKLKIDQARDKLESQGDKATQRALADETGLDRSLIQRHMSKVA